MNKENILTVADAIENHDRTDGIGFHMGGFYDEGSIGGAARDYAGHKCGTAACIAGWTVHVLNPVWLSGGLSGLGEEAANLLGLSEDKADRLFWARGCSTGLNGGITPSEAVCVMRNLVKTGEVSWS